MLHIICTSLLVKQLDEVSTFRTVVTLVQKRNKTSLHVRGTSVLAWTTHQRLSLIYMVVRMSLPVQAVPMVLSPKVLAQMSVDNYVLQMENKELCCKWLQISYNFRHLSQNTHEPIT